MFKSNKNWTIYRTLLQRKNSAISLLSRHFKTFFDPSKTMRKCQEIQNVLLEVWIRLNDFGPIVAILTLHGLVWAGLGCQNGPKYPSWAGLVDTWSNQNLQFAEKLLILNEKPRSILKFEGHPEMMCNFLHLTMNGKHIIYFRIASS